jgi:spore coat polysaccharide biosynthesis protein SpsF (cytidylyltransferase family)
MPANCVGGDEGDRIASPLVIFHNVQDAVDSPKSIQTVERFGEPVSTYSADVSVRVTGDAPKTLNEFREFLIRVTDFRLNEALDNGSLVHLEIDWRKLRGR